MTKYTLKKLVKTKITELARTYLTNLKQNHSKSAGLSSDYEKMQDYLDSDKISTEEKQLLFKFCTRTYPCKTNFRKQYEPDLSCFICFNEDTPEHLLNCTLSEGIDRVQSYIWKYCATDQSYRSIEENNSEKGQPS